MEAFFDGQIHAIPDEVVEAVMSLILFAESEDMRDKECELLRAFIKKLKEAQE